ncbi:uncharacterized protein LOC127857728 isoform X2 [Dreissena polymorpha]|uniref:uncharacterized protein LOC127857728 isoform X2 n=1 Tax=Dreissena polymorpha TaxID=45954 RepID=UPI00226527D6|nr:uncharacterized protein LOC127857728 isoform X2 [Dreissena polymorpha]
MGNCHAKKTSAISPRGKGSHQDICAVLSQNTPNSRSGIVYNDMESMLRHGEEILQPLTGAQKPVVSAGGVAFDVDMSKVRPRRLPPINADNRPSVEARPPRPPKKTSVGTKKKSTVKAQNVGTVEKKDDDEMPVRRKVIKHVDSPRPPRPQDFGFEFSNEEDQLMKEIMREHALKEKQEKARRLAEGRRASTNEVALSASAPQATTSITAAIPVMQYTAEEDELMHEILGADTINQRREKARRMSERRHTPARLERPRAAKAQRSPCLVKHYVTEEEAIIEEIMCDDVPTERPPKTPKTEDDLFIEEILNDDYLEEASKAFKAAQDATIADILNDDVSPTSANKIQGRGDGRPRTQGLSTRAASQAGSTLK